MQPDLILSSPAVRALTTAEIMAREMGYKRKAIIVDERIYAAEPEALLAVIAVGLMAYAAWELSAVLWLPRHHAGQGKAWMRQAGAVGKSVVYGAVGWEAPARSAKRWSGQTVPPGPVSIGIRTLLPHSVQLPS